MGLIMFKYDLFMTEQKEGETDSNKEKNWIWPIPPLAADVSFKLRWYSSHMTGASEARYRVRNTLKLWLRRWRLRFV